MYVYFKLKILLNEKKMKKKLTISEQLLTDIMMIKSRNSLIKSMVCNENILFCFVGTRLTNVDKFRIIHKKKTFKNILKQIFFSVSIVLRSIYIFNKLFNYITLIFYYRVHIVKIGNII